jgi:putative heme-binding domain-containing protein
MTCHSRAAAFVLGLTEAQLNRDHDYGSIRDNQLRALDHIDIFTERLKPPSTLSRLADPYDAKNDLEARVRSYLHVNCSVCHVSAGGGNSKMELGIATSREKMSLLQARPQHDTFGIADAMLVAPSDPRRSVLVRRLSQRGRGQMPPLAISRVDERAVQLMTDWIAGMKPDKPIVGQWKMTDFPAIEQVNAGRSVESGQRAFRETGCAQCHRFGGEGGLVGPDLTNIGKRLTPQNLLESILLPSKTIADEYATFIVETEDGKIVSGRVEREDIQFLVLRPASSNEPPIKIEKTQIVERQRSNTSNMPSGTVNVLQKEEVLDLIGYLLAPAKE